MGRRTEKRTEINTVHRRITGRVENISGNRRVVGHGAIRPIRQLLPARFVVRRGRSLDVHDPTCQCARLSGGKSHDGISQIRRWSAAFIDTKGGHAVANCQLKRGRERVRSVARLQRDRNRAGRFAPRRCDPRNDSSRTVQHEARRQTDRPICDRPRKSAFEKSAKNVIGKMLGDDRLRRPRGYSRRRQAQDADRAILIIGDKDLPVRCATLDICREAT